MVTALIFVLILRFSIDYIMLAGLLISICTHYIYIAISSLYSDELITNTISNLPNAWMFFNSSESSVVSIITWCREYKPLSVSFLVAVFNVENRSICARTCEFCYYGVLLLLLIFDAMSDEIFFRVAIKLYTEMQHVDFMLFNHISITWCR